MIIAMLIQSHLLTYLFIVHISKGIWYNYGIALHLDLKRLVMEGLWSL